MDYSRTVGGFTIVHSTLDMPEKWGYVFEELEAETHFSAIRTHPYAFMDIPTSRYFSSVVMVFDVISTMIIKMELGKKYFVNVGSCRSAARWGPSCGVRDLRHED